MQKVNLNHEIVQRESQIIAKTQKIPYAPIAFKSGEGALLYDYEGKEYIDFLSSASSANIGHGNVEIAEAVKKQMEELAQYAMAYFSSEKPVELAEKLGELTGETDMQVAYATTGSASIDGAIKVARAYTGRSKLISFMESYHGSTYGAISVSALSTNMRRKIGPLLSEVVHFNYPICVRCKYGKKEASCHLECLKEIKYAFQHYLPAEEVAAVIMEPIAGDAGLVIPPKRYMQELHKLCKEHGILLISDEIQQGLGRTGKWFAMEHFGIKPDLYVLGKSVGGGLPLGVLIGKAKIMEALEAPGHLFSMSGNSAVCAASLKMFEIYEREELNKASEEKGKYLKEKLEKLMEKYDIIGDVRGLGLSIGVDLVKDRATMEKDYIATAKISYRCIENGLILIFVGQSTLRVQPPLVITYEQLDKAVSILEQAIQDYVDGKIGDEVMESVKGW